MGLMFLCGCASRSASHVPAWNQPRATATFSQSQITGELPAPDLLAKISTRPLDEDGESAAAIQQVGFVTSAKRQETGELPSPGAAPGPPAGPIEATAIPVQGDDGPSLLLPEVLASVARAYPEIEVAIGEIESAQGKILASWGEFDSVFAAHSISQPLGFYKTYRNGVELAQPLYSGGQVFGAYRLGDGNFEPWYGERETNEGGELKAGVSLPLRKDRAIDARRTAVATAKARRDQVVSDIDSRVLLFERFATQAYWDWVAAGRAVQVQFNLLELARRRAQKIDDRVDSGDLAEIARFDNQRFIAKRTNGLIKARRGLQKAAIKLSLFYRDAQGQPLIADASQLPSQTPDIAAIEDERLAADIQLALEQRPELQVLAALRNEAVIALQYARNLTLTKVDLKAFAGQDLGGATSSKGDKTPFEMQIGFLAEVPLQRREGQGKIQAAQGKLVQVDAKLRMTSDKVRAEIQDAASAVNAAIEQIEQSRQNLELARESLELGRVLFERGDIDLISLNIYETSVADAELELIEAEFKAFFYLAQYRTAIMDGSMQTVLGR